MLNTYRLLLEMMDPAERRRFWLLVVITFLLTVLEVGSVVSILPFLQLIAEPERIQEIAVLDWLYRAGGFTDIRSFQIAAGLLVFTLTITGLGMKTLTIWLTTRFALMRAYSFSARLLGNYLHQPYEWFLSRHTSNLSQTILSEVDRVVGEALLPAMRLIPDVFAVILLVVALCIIEPWVALGGAVSLAVVYGLIYIVVRRLLANLGAIQLAANQIRFHVIQEATGGTKELKIMGLEDGFLVRYRHAAFRLATTQTHGQVIGAVPRQAIEAVAFGGMILLILVLLSRGDGRVVALIPTLGLIAAIGLRVIPALQQVYQRSTSIRMSQSRLARVHGDLTQLRQPPPEDRQRRDARPSLHLQDRLHLSGLSYSYPSSERPTLDNLDIAISANTTVGIVGGTGAGKTTLVDIILGLLSPASGEMLVDGIAITEENRRSWQKTLGYVPQTIFLSDSTLAENIAFGIPRDEIDMAAVERAARIAALHAFVTAELPEGYDTEVGERGVRLSGGQRQRVGIARALYHDPTTLIFDEATSALDTVTEAAVMDAVTRIAGEKTILMIAHRLSTVKDCDKILLLQHGKVVDHGSFDDLLARNPDFQRMAAGTLSPGVAPDRAAAIGTDRPQA